MKISAGILVYRKINQQVEFFLVCPGGPFYKISQDGIWTFPKGIVEENESEIEAAKREFKEETGFHIHQEIKHLKTIKLRQGKRVSAYCCAGDFDANEIKSQCFEMEYPKNSGQIVSFPEIEAANWFSYSQAKLKIHPKLLPFLNQVLRILDSE
jgi:predicted NUDIX family NTP pyrophosphohydrolase